MKRISIARLALAMLLLGSMATPSIADTLWFNGDYDFIENHYVDNQISSTLTARTYDDFLVPASGWTINTLYSNIVNPYSNTFEITGVDWEIRQDMVGTHDPPYRGNGGTLISSGTITSSDPNFSVTSTGRYSGNDTLHQYPEQTVAVTGLNLSLLPGTYWLSVTPYVTGDDGVCNTVTIGTNATGFIPGNGFASYSNADPPVLYADGYYVLNGPIDYSMGIDGTAGSQVPLPPSILLLASALLRLGVHGFRVRGR
jgi:hypothetical protein